MTALLAFHNDPAIKAKYLQRVELHAAQDEIIHGKYWERGKGCAVGCTIHSGNHKAYETELGIPIMLARLEDRLFEGQSNGKSKQFPVGSVLREGGMTIVEEAEKARRAARQADALADIVDTIYTKRVEAIPPDTLRAIVQAYRAGYRHCRQDIDRELGAAMAKEAGL